MFGEDDRTLDQESLEEENETLKAQLAQVQREAGALRTALVHERHCRECGEGPCCDECTTEAALSSDAGKGYVSPEEHQALQKAAGALLEIAKGIVFSETADGQAVGRCTASHEDVQSAIHSASRFKVHLLTESECQARVDAALQPVEEVARRHGWDGVENSKVLHVYLERMLSGDQERIDAAVRATWEEAARVTDEWGVEHRCPEGQRIAASLRARASGDGGGS